MSKERAKRRAEREALRALALARHERAERRRARWRALRRRLTPGRRAWGLGRRSGGQRAVMAGVTIGLLWMVWYLLDSWPLRIALTLLLLLLLPVLAVVTFDRKGMRL